MNSKDESYFSIGGQRKVDIPKIFKTFVSEEYFQNCIVCDRYLLDETVEYVIEKAIRENAVEVEYAMCLPCVEKMQEKLSEKSQEAITKYFEHSLDVMTSRYDLMMNPNSTVDDYLSNCAINGQSASNFDEYQIFAHCCGKKVILSAFPYLVSIDVIEELQELLSAKTKDELDRFTDEYFGLPPELKEIIRGKRLILI